MTALHTWSSPSPINSCGGSVRNCNCIDDGEHAKDAKDEHGGWRGGELHDFDDVERIDLFGGVASYSWSL